MANTTPTYVRLGGSVPAQVGDVAAPAANTAAVVTYAAIAGFSHVIDGVVISYSATPAGGNLQIKDGASVILNADIGAAGIVVIPFQHPKRGSPNTAMTITLTAAGASVSGKVSVLGHYLED